MVGQNPHRLGRMKSYEYLEPRGLLVHLRYENESLLGHPLPAWMRHNTFKLLSIATEMVFLNGMQSSNLGSEVNKSRPNGRISTRTCLPFPMSNKQNVGIVKTGQNPCSKPTKTNRTCFGLADMIIPPFIIWTLLQTHTRGGLACFIWAKSSNHETHTRDPHKGLVCLFVGWIPHKELSCMMSQSPESQLVPMSLPN